MTCAYSTYFVLVWGSVALAVPAAVALLGLSVRWTVPHEHWNATADAYDGEAHAHAHTLRYALGYGGVALLALWTTLMRLHGPRLHVRAGAWPSLGCGDAYPTSEEELVAAVRHIRRRHGRNPEIVGAAWGFFLRRRGPVGPRVYTHRFKGLQPNGRWAAGTTIDAVVRHYEKRGRTFSTHPTMDYISVGAWFAMGNHGNGGNHPLTKGSSGTLKDAHVLDMDSMIIMTMDYPALRRAFDASPRSYCLLSVAFKEDAMIDDVWVQKEGVFVDSAHSAERWLAEDAHLRVMFQGAGRAYALGARWNPVPKRFVPQRGVHHIDPHSCQRWCFYTQMDTCSAACGWHEPITHFDGYTTYADANRWMPPVLPVQELLVVLAGYRNYEIIFRLPYALSGVTLWPLVRALIKMHEEIGGRSELRYGKGGPDTPIFLDMAIRRELDRPFRLLYHQFGVREVALHPGKFWPASTRPCARVSQATVYGMDTPLAVAVAA
ncbi:MAG: hypothetical protein ACKVI4_16570 [Actinomycetales bacterium]